MIATRPNILARYTHWLHTRWPAGTVEPLPKVNADGSTHVPGLYVVGDLTGVPLLKFSADSGAKAVALIAEKQTPPDEKDALDLVIVGGGVSGMAAALEARKRGLRFEIIEASEPFSTIVNFPQGKPIYTYPSDMKPAGDLQFTPEIHPREQLLDELRKQTIDQGIKPMIGKVHQVKRAGALLQVELDEGRPALVAKSVIIAIGRSGNYRKLNVPGEELAKVSNRLHDPKEFAGKDVLVVGGGDSALEAAIAIAQAGGRVTLSYRKTEFARPKPENIEQLQALPGIKVMLGSNVKNISAGSVELMAGKNAFTEKNDAVLTLIGREAPLDFFRRSGVPIHGEWRTGTIIGLVLFLLFCVFVYHWKSNLPAELPIRQAFEKRDWFPFNFKMIEADWKGKENTFAYTLRKGLSNPSFYYTLAYCSCIVGFGIARIRRRRTPYVTRQTITLMLFQCIPLFILPEIVLPYAGRNGAFEQDKPMRWIADQLFETYDGAIGHERAYWRSYGFILAFPLNVYNVFTGNPLWLWLVICFLQTFVLIPLIVLKWGKGAYCGWICSCGALAETMGDAHRQKMPHGPAWNRLNMVGQVALGFAFIILLFRIIGWLGAGWAMNVSDALFNGIPFVNYSWSVDILMGGILGVGFYFWFSGRTWCRFACPLAALMHIYARFTRFRILADKKKCISCNVCTTVCHQGIDVMSFANKGKPMEDPQCVRCSACVQSCPTGVLTFGEINRKTGAVIRTDKLQASPVQMIEMRVRGEKVVSR